MRSSRGAVLAAVLGLCLPGCKREFLSDVPTLTGSSCTIRLNDARSNVLLRCGAPCGGGEVAPDLHCDVYVSSEVCYRDSKVATLSRLPPFNGRFAWCTWDAPREPSDSEGDPEPAPGAQAPDGAAGADDAHLPLDADAATP